MDADKMQRRYQGYAARWVAEVDNEGLSLEPTDANIAAVMADCVRRPRPEELPSIRIAIRAYRRVRS